VAELRNELQLVCGADTAREDRIETAVGVAVEHLNAIEHAIEVEGGLPVKVVGQAGDVTVAAPGGIEVTNPPDVASVRAAVDAGTETANQNMWALAGIFLGGVLLGWVFRMVRP
jgi:hypothetical protein